jgi:hypothetical protein
MKTDSQSTDPRPTFNELLDFAEGRLSGSEHQRIATYLREHPQEVATDWAWVQAFLKKTRDLELHELPPGLEESLIQVHAADPEVSPMETVRGWVTAVRRVAAELVDPGIGADFAAAGLRSKAFEKPAQQWVFRTEEVDIWINALERPDQRFDLHGQVFALTEDEGTGGMSAQLLREDHETGLAAVDDYGEFMIPAVSSGAYALVIAGKGIEVHCTPVSFGN